MKEKRSGSKCVFSIMELLIVVAILVILISLLLPALGKARGSGLMVSCAAKSRAIGQALSMYLHDFGDTLPKDPYWSTPTSADGATFQNQWMGYLSERVNGAYGLTRSEKSFACPACPENDDRVHDFGIGSEPLENNVHGKPETFQRWKNQSGPFSGKRCSLYRQSVQRRVLSANHHHLDFIPASASRSETPYQQQYSHACRESIQNQCAVRRFSHYSPLFSAGSGTQRFFQ